MFVILLLSAIAISALADSYDESYWRKREFERQLFGEEFNSRRHQLEIQRELRKIQDQNDEIIKRQKEEFPRPRRDIRGNVYDY